MPRKQVMERRAYPASLEQHGTSREPILEGHIAVFNQLSEDFGGWREKIAPGAFLESIGRDDIRALWNHDSNLVLGRVSAGTLSLREDGIGLYFENRPPDTTWFRDGSMSISRGDVTGASFGFYTEEDAWDTKGETRIRILKRVRLVEVSPGVTFPAYPQTDVALASMRGWFGESQVDAKYRDRQRVLRLQEMEMEMAGWGTSLEVRLRQLRKMAESLR